MSHAHKHTHARAHEHAHTNLIDTLCNEAGDYRDFRKQANEHEMFLRSHNNIESSERANPWKAQFQSHQYAVAKVLGRPCHEAFEGPLPLAVSPNQLSCRVGCFGVQNVAKLDTAEIAFAASRQQIGDERWYRLTRQVSHRSRDLSRCDSGCLHILRYTERK